MPVSMHAVDQIKSHLSNQKYLSNAEIATLLGDDQQSLKDVRDILISEQFAKDDGKLLGLKLEDQPANQDDYDIFISYSHKDKWYVEQIVHKIREVHSKYSPVPLKLFWDQPEIKVMDDWQHKIQIALKKSKVMISVLSPNYFESNYCEYEWRQFVGLETDHALLGEAISPLYTVTIPGLEAQTEAQADSWKDDLKKRQFCDIRNWWDDGMNSKIEESINETFEDLNRVMYDKIAKVGRHLGSKSYIPPHNRSFVGRIDQLRKLRERLMSSSLGNVVAIQGLPGMGKSALAYEYAHVNGSFYPGGRYFIDASALKSLRDGIIGLAPWLGMDITHVQNAEVEHKMVIEKLNRSEKSLILFDNVDDMTLFSKSERGKFLPFSDQVDIYLTTRAAAKDIERTGIEVLQIDKLDPDWSLRLLSRFKSFKDEEEMQAAAEICRLVDGYPIALEIIGSYVWFRRDEKLSYVAYLDEIKTKGLVYLDLTGEDAPDLASHNERIFSKLFTEFGKRLDIHESFILLYCSFFPPGHIPEWWLSELYEMSLGLFRELILKSDFKENRKMAVDFILSLSGKDEYSKEEVAAVNSLFQFLESGLETPQEKFNKVIRKLKGYQLVSEGANENTVQMHRLIHANIDSEKNKAANEKNVHEFIFSKSTRLIEGSNWFQPAYRREFRPLIDFFYYILPNHAQNYWGAIIAVTNALVRIGNVREAGKLLEETLSYLHFPYAVESVLTSLKNVYIATGEREKLAVCEERLAIFATGTRSPFSDEDEDLAAEFIRLRSIGSWKEAIELGEKIVALHEQKEGKTEFEYRRLSDLQAVLSTIYSETGDMAKSLNMSLAAIDNLEKLYPDGHIDLIPSYIIAAGHFSRLARPGETKFYAEKAMQLIDKYQLRRTNLYPKAQALLIIFEDDKVEKRSMIMEMIEVYTELYGEKGPDLAAYYKLLADLESRENNYEEALNAMDKSIEIFVGIYGDEHPELVHLYAELYRITCHYNTSDAFFKHIEEYSRMMDEESKKFLTYSSPAFRETAIFMKIGELLAINNLPEYTLEMGELALTNGLTHLKRKQYLEGIQALHSSMLILSKAIGEDHEFTMYVIDLLNKNMLLHKEKLPQEFQDRIDYAIAEMGNPYEPDPEKPTPPVQADEPVHAEQKESFFNRMKKALGF